MGKPDKAAKGKESAPGQTGTAKGHQAPREVYDAAGNPVDMNQAQWKDRDKTAGFTRPEDEDEEETAEEPVAPAG